MNQVPDMIGRYARLSFVADAYLAQGMAPPPNVAFELQQIETRAQAMLSPEQLRAAEQHMHVAKNRIAQETSAAVRERHAEQAQRAGEKFLRNLTRSMAGQHEGLSQEQYNALLEGKPIPAHRTLTQQERDQAFRENTARFDPQGRGWSEKEWTQRLDQLADASDQQFGQLSQGYLTDRAALRKTATNWRDERIGYEIERRRAERDGPAPEPKANDDDIRRADLLKSFGDHVYESGRPEMIDTLRDDTISRESLEDDGMRGDIARAWDTTKGNDDD